jgi:hypothetical protein
VHVLRDLKKIKNGVQLSPILLVRGNLDTGAQLTIADGYHRKRTGILSLTAHTSRFGEMQWAFYFGS